MSISSSFGGHVVALLYSCKPARGGDQVSTLSRSLLSSTNTHGAPSMACFYPRFPVGAAGRPPADFGIGHIWAVNKTLFEASENSKTFLQLLQGILVLQLQSGFVTDVIEYAIFPVLRWGVFSTFCSTIPAPKKRGRISGGSTVRTDSNEQRKIRGSKSLRFFAGLAWWIFGVPP